MTEQHVSHDPRIRASKFGRAWLDEWLLDRDFTHLNHGTVGATPRRVLEVQRRLSDEIERNPAGFLTRELCWPLVGEARQTGEARLRRAAREIGAHFGARGEDVVFVENTTNAINAVLRSIDFRTGDEILLLDHAYGAIRITAEYIAQRAGARVCSAELPFPRIDAGLAVAAVERAITPRTRIAILDHVTSPSALVMPIAELAHACRKRGVPVLVDGAHAPGAVPFEIPALGVDWYAGNLHKWAWAPRSCALLWATPARQVELHPTTISWGYGNCFSAEFDWPGTRDPTPCLAAPAGLAWMQTLGIAEVQRYNHELVMSAGKSLAERWGTNIDVPESMVGTMISARLPERAGSTTADANRLRDVLYYEHKIEVPFMALQGAVWARVSAQIYNEPAEYERLGQVVLDVLR